MSALLKSREAILLGALLLLLIAIAARFPAFVAPFQSPRSVQ